MSKHQEGHKWPEAKRIEVVTTYLALGNANLVEAITRVPAGTVRQWKTQPWWKELISQIQTESDQELDTKLAKRIDKALDLINDRLENGDFMYDPKTGEFMRKPVSLRDTWKVANEMLDKRWLIRKQPKDLVAQEAVGDMLKSLAKQFADMATKKVKEVLDGPSTTELSDGVRELPGSTQTDPQPIPSESGS